MSNRSTNILGRILRNLQRHGLTVSDVTDDDIWSELTQGVNNIISEIRYRKVVPITLQTDVDIYSLTTGDNKDNIASVKVLKMPTGWRYDFKILPNSKFIKVVNENQGTAIKQPVVGTVIDGNLKIFPVPSSDYNNVELEFWCMLKSSTQNVDKDNEPEIPDMWDKALEVFATAQFLSGNDRAQFLNEYTVELKRLRPLASRDNHPLQRPDAYNEQTTEFITDDYT